MTSRSRYMVVFLLVGIVLSAIGVIYSKHTARQLFAELQILQQRRDELHAEWTQLLLEQGTWATNARVERFARERLNMWMPPTGEIEVLRIKSH